MQLRNYKPIPGFDHYLVSKSGQLYNTKTKRFIYAYRHQSRVNKYLRAGLYSAGKCTRYFLHELVLLAWTGPKPYKYEVDHIDGNTFNNNLNNLEYVTSSENKKRAAKLRTKKGA